MSPFRLAYSLVILLFLPVITCTAQSSSSPVSLMKELQTEEEIKLIFTLDMGNPPSGLNYSRAGNYISSLGDINGDSFDDWVAGLPGTSNYYGNGVPTGAIHLYFGSSERRQPETPADMVMYGLPYENLGQNITAAGDFNGDGFDDMLSYNYESIDGETPGFKWNLYLGGNPFDSIADLTFSKLDIHAGNPNFASSAGDVNGDGYDDILLSVETALWSPDTSRVYIFLGSENMDNEPDIILNGRVNIPELVKKGAITFNRAVGAGDVNNDGYDDVIVRAYDGAELFFGGENMDTERDLHYNDFDGRSMGTRPIVRGAGDLNNDGFDDLLMLINFVPQVAHVFYGSAVPDAVPDVSIPMWNDKNPEFSSASACDVNKDGYDDVILGTGGLWSLDTTAQVRIFLGGTGMDSIQDFTLTGSVKGNNFGYSLGGGGDFDGDGYDDLLVGDVGKPATFDTSDDAGGISIFYGGSTVNSSPDAVFSGVSNSCGFGTSVADAGDVNNDGYTDLLVGAPYYKYNYSAGKAFLYFGGDSLDKEPDVIFESPTTYIGTVQYLGKKVGAAGDINGDGYDDIYIVETRKVLIYLGGEDMDTLPDYTFSSPSSTEITDYFNFSSVGDVNKDGYDDVLFSDSKVGAGGTTWLYLGGTDLMSGLAATFTGLNPGDNLGSLLCGAGDVNGDAYMDFLITAPGDDANGTDAGCTMVYFGGDVISDSPALRLPGVQDQQNYGISAICGGGDINNDGYDDIAYADPYFSLTPTSFEGRIYIYYGGSTMDSIPDVVLTGDNTNANLGIILEIIPDSNGDDYDELLSNNSQGMLAVYYGSASIDLSEDLSVAGLGSFNDFSYAEKDSTAIFYFGDSFNNGPGPGSGRVFAYSNLSPEIKDTTVVDTTTTGKIIPGIQLQKSRNYPNPFIQSTVISYYLPVDDFVEIRVYNVLGELVNTLLYEHQSTGQHEVKFNADGLKGGLYIYSIKAGSSISVGKMFLLE